jgi:hypothetical protein
MIGLFAVYWHFWFSRVLDRANSAERPRFRGFHRSNHRLFVHFFCLTNSTQHPHSSEMGGSSAFRAGRAEPASVLDLIMQRQQEGAYLTNTEVIDRPLMRVTIDAAAMREYEAVEAAGFPNRQDPPPNAGLNENVEFNVSNGLITGYHFCRKTTKTSRCGGCRVVYYCGQEHQSIDRAAHKAACSKIRRERTRLEVQETTPSCSCRRY